MVASSKQSDLSWLMLKVMLTSVYSFFRLTNFIPGTFGRTWDCKNCICALIWLCCKLNLWSLDFNFPEMLNTLFIDLTVKMYDLINLEGVVPQSLYLYSYLAKSWPWHMTFDLYHFGLDNFIQYAFIALKWSSCDQGIFYKITISEKYLKKTWNHTLSCI